MRAPVLYVLALGLSLSSRAPAQSSPAYPIATVAGSGPGNVLQGGCVGDGGPAGSATLNNPTSVAVDRAGDIYFCDWNARIRKIDVRTGLITTIAGTGMWGIAGDGGPAVNAQLGGPGGAGGGVGGVVGGAGVTRVCLSTS